MLPFMARDWLRLTPGTALSTPKTYISAHFGGSFEVTALTESVTFEEREIEFINATDIVTAHFGGSFEVTFSESVSVLTDNILFDVYSTDYEDQIVSSDGLWFLRSSQ